MSAISSTRQGEPIFARLFQIWDSATRRQRFSASMWLFYALFYWMLPTALAVAGLWIAKREVRWVDLWVHGEFLIYSITLTAGSTRLIAKDEPFPNRQMFNLFAQIIIFPAIFTYGLVRYLFATSGSTPVDVPLMTTYSIILLVVSFLFSYVVFRVDHQLSSIPAFAKEAAAEIEAAPERLGVAFDSLAEGGEVPRIARTSNRQLAMDTPEESSEIAPLFDSSPPVQGSETEDSE